MTVRSDARRSRRLQISSAAPTKSIRIPKSGGGAPAACGPVWAYRPNHRLTLLVPFWRKEFCETRFSARRRKPPASGVRSPVPPGGDRRAQVSQPSLFSSQAGRRSCGAWLGWRIRPRITAVLGSPFSDRWRPKQTAEEPWSSAARPEAHALPATASLRLNRNYSAATTEYTKHTKSNCRPAGGRTRITGFTFQSPSSVRRELHPDSWGMSESFPASQAEDCPGA